MDGMTEVVARLVERVENRYFGKYRGVVTDNADPDNLGRLRARVPRLLGTVETGWALPAAPYGGTTEQGFFAIPDIGASVWLEFEGGELAYPVWTGTWWSTDERPESASPAKKVLKTKAGHSFVFDDDAENVILTDSNGNKITFDSSGIKLEDANGNSLTLDSGGVTIKGTVIKVGDPATDALVAFNMLDTALTQFATSVQTHTHVGNLGAPTSPPVPPPVLSIASAKSKHKLEV